MTILLIVALCIVTAVIVLTMPIIVEIDTARPYASIVLLHLVHVRVYVSEASGEWIREVQVPGKRFRVKKGVPKTHKQQARELKNAQPQSKKRWRPKHRRIISSLPSMLRRLRKALKILEFKAAFDSGDVILNAQLFALQPLLAAHGLNIVINFNKHNWMYSKLKLRPYYILLAALAFAWNIFTPLPSSNKRLKT